MPKVLTEAEFEKLTKDLPEDGFRTLLPVLMDSFSRKRGRTLDATQVASLCVGLMEMSATIDAQITLVGQMQQELINKQQELDECQAKKVKLWRP